MIFLSKKITKMKTKLLILLLLIISSCKPAKVKQEESLFEEIEEIENIETEENTETNEKTKVVEDFEVNTNFQIIPQKNECDTVERIIKVKDNSGTETEIKFNPNDLLIFNSNSKIKRELEETKQELSTYKQQNKSLRKELRELHTKSEKKQNSFFDRIGKWVISILILLIIIYLFRSLWKR